MSVATDSSGNGIIAPLLEPWLEGWEEGFTLEDENRSRGSAPPNRRIAGGGTVTDSVEL